MSATKGLLKYSRFRVIHTVDYGLHVVKGVNMQKTHLHINRLPAIVYSVSQEPTPKLRLSMVLTPEDNRLILAAKHRLEQRSEKSMPVTDVVREALRILVTTLSSDV